MAGPKFDLLAWGELKAALPLDRAMPNLLAIEPAPEPLQVLAAAASAELGALPLCAGIWLYVDSLDRSHNYSQGLSSPVGALWHGIMHRREGDFSNAKYWFGQASGDPAYAALGHDPIAFVDEVSKARGTDPPELVATQRREWLGLFEWCMKEAGSER